jgi:hypothetical protein
MPKIGTALATQAAASATPAAIWASRYRIAALSRACTRLATSADLLALAVGRHQRAAGFFAVGAGAQRRGGDDRGVAAGQAREVGDDDDEAEDVADDGAEAHGFHGVLSLAMTRAACGASSACAIHRQRIEATSFGGAGRV